MIRAKNYEKLSKFVKVRAKILSIPFFLDTVYILNKKRTATAVWFLTNCSFHRGYIFQPHHLCLYRLTMYNKKLSSHRDTARCLLR